MHVSSYSIISFIIGIISASFTNRNYAYYLLLIQALSSIMLCIILLNPSEKYYKPNYMSKISFSEAVNQAISCMINVCATVIIFRVFLSILNHYFLRVLNHEWIAGLTGIVELTNGAILLKEIPDVAFRFITAAGTLSFGGLCVHMQTVSVSSPGSYRYYLIGSIIKAGISIILASIFTLFNSIYKMLIIYLITAIILKITKNIVYKKTVAIPKKMMYNTSTS